MSSPKDLINAVEVDNKPKIQKIKEVESKNLIQESLV